MLLALESWCTLYSCQGECKQNLESGCQPNNSIINNLPLSLSLSPFDAKKKNTTLSWVFYIISIYSYLQMYTDVIYMMQTNFTSKTAEFLRSFEQATQNSMQDGVGRSHTTGAGWLSRSISDRFSCLWSWVPRVDPVMDLCENVRIVSWGVVIWIYLLIWENWDLS